MVGKYEMHSLVQEAVGHMVLAGDCGVYCVGKRLWRVLYMEEDCWVVQCNGREKHIQCGIQLVGSREISTREILWLGIG